MLFLLVTSSVGRVTEHKGNVGHSPLLLLVLFLLVILTTRKKRECWTFSPPSTYVLLCWDTDTPDDLRTNPVEWLLTPYNDESHSLWNTNQDNPQPSYNIVWVLKLQSPEAVGIVAAAMGPVLTVPKFTTEQPFLDRNAGIYSRLVYWCIVWGGMGDEKSWVRGWVIYSTLYDIFKIVLLYIQDCCIVSYCLDF